MSISIYQQPFPESLVGVDVALIRNTFYNMMARHAITSKLIQQEALIDQESYIYFVLSVHALIAALNDSKNIRGGICLLKQKVVTVDNCPQEFKAFVQAVIQIKTMARFTPKRHLNS